MSDTPAQGTPPLLWSEANVRDALSSYPMTLNGALQVNLANYESAIAICNRIIGSYEADRQRLIAELAESQAYALTLERALGEAKAQLDVEMADELEIAMGRIVELQRENNILFDKGAQRLMHIMELEADQRRTSSSPTAAPQDAPPA